MAVTRMTLREIKAIASRRSRAEQAEFRRRLDETTEADIRRHMVEDNEDPDQTPPFDRPVLPGQVRKKLCMTQTEFAALLGIPVATLRNWEQNRFVMEPAARTLLKVIDREPVAALRALRGPKAA